MGTCGCPRTRCLALVLYWMTSSEVPSPGPGISQIRSKLFKQLAFSKPVYSFELEEDTVPGTTLGYVEASHALQDRQISYSLVEDDGDGLFLLNPVSGEVTLSRALDYESEQTYILTLGAGYGEAQFAWVRVYVNVLDVNDNPPVFSFDAYTISVLEDIPVGTCIFGLNVTDADDGVNAELNSAIISGDNEGRFAVGSNGIICLQRALDRETESIYSLTIQVSDCALPEDTRLTSTAHITVYIEDVNDNAPFFTSGEKVHVPENMPVHSVVTVVHALDVDAGANSAVEYVLEHMSGNTFRIDSSSGRVYLQKELDREQTSMLTVLLTVRDKGSPQLSSSMNLSVFIDDVNDNAPIFTKSSYKVTVMEDVPRGLPLCQVFASDADGGPNGQIRYSIYQSQFVIDSLSGDISVMGSLDREKHPSYTLTVIAMDQGDVPRSATATVHVLLTDVNDFVPTFSPSLVTVHVLENLEQLPLAIEQVSAIDEDLGVNSQLTYTITRGNEDELFALSPTGTLSVWHSLDRELKAHYTLEVIAVDSGSIVCAVRAVDLDTGINAQLTFSLFGSNSDQFSIDPIRGVIFAAHTTTAPKDMTLSVRVRDGGKEPKTDTTTVTVRFQSASQIPRVAAASHEHLLSEDVALNTQVTVVTAESERRGLVGPISYYLAAGNFEEAFQVHQQTGILTVNNPLDYETNSEFQIWVEARDAGLPPYSSYIKIHISISDVNDNAPVFTRSSYRCEVFENMPASLVCQVLAVDLDRGFNGEVQYSILTGDTENTFTVDADTGVIRTRKSIDREKTWVYNLTVQARDKGNRFHTGTTLVVVTVLDTNDNAPRFSQIFFTEIPENTPVGFTVIQITSTDADIGVNAVSTYMIVNTSGSVPFAIDNSNGYVTVIRPLDREIKDHYVVRVNANDSAWSVNTEVTIYITDINDNRPVFSQLSYSITIPETKAREVFILQVNARDSDLGQNGQVFYYIQPPSDLFKINASTGDVLTKQPISLHEVGTQNHSFLVVASDCGVMPNLSNVTVRVNFVQYNYFPPMFLPFQPLISVPFNLDVGTKVMQLSAIDKDSGDFNGTVEYFVTGGNASRFFKVEQNSGSVFVNTSLKQIFKEMATLLVTAKDKGVPPLSTHTSVSFLITENNHFAPHFSATQVTFVVREDLPVGSVIGKVKAEDKDPGPNGILYYSIIEAENEEKIFSIGQSTGFVTLIASLDFDKQKVHSLQVTAKDDGWISKTGNLNVIVEVQDVNDNPPIFSATEYLVSLPENLPIGTTVLQVKATDMDSGVNSQISYSLLKGDVDGFALDSQNGVLTTQEVFDFELQQNYEVTVKASNTDSQGHFSLAQVHILITDVNEYRPRFSRSQYHFTVSERALVGTKVGHVFASDSDLGVDGEVFYLLIGQSKKAGFDIDKRSGDIFVTGDLKQHAQNQAVLRILAKNKGSITGTDVEETLVLVSVMDANDPPTFSSSVYHVDISEGTAVGTSVVKVKAEDQDFHSNWNNFSYSIESGNHNGSFSVHPVTGFISIVTPLDREQWAFYNLTVTAIDGAPIAGTGSTKVLIVVSDINDNAPILSSVEGHVRENEPHGTIVTIMNATDADLPPNQGPFTYQLGQSEASSYFTLTSDGVLSTIRPLDREEHRVFPVIVVIQDAGIPPQSATATVHITVLDENDNPPMVRNMYIEVKYYGSSFSGGLIGNVRPEDPDVSDEFNCSLRIGPRNLFSFPSNGCDLWSSPYQGEAKFNLTIAASDNRHIPVNSSVYVNYKGFTNATIDNCILFYVTSPQFEVFLSINYLKLIKALDSLFNLQASKIHVFGMKPLGNTTLLLAAVKNYNGQYISGTVASGIFTDQKEHLEAQSNIKISLITSDPCFSNPCHHQGTCNKNVDISQDISILESSTVIFVSPKHVEIFNCSCLPGYTGLLCELDIDECNGGPCDNGAACVNYPGGFSCNCTSGYSGPFCSSDINECKNISCHNGGTCLNIRGGFYCDCNLGYVGKYQFVFY
ncbi:protocadherin Fat 4 [Amia ocellicauda]|uniref:protocadherin Fat 4 n=1 Tax=Amia ocellicauda TaxID=2972642 RepID=UPI0034643782